MSFIRPGAASALLRLREVGLAAGLVLLGLWFVWLGGWVLGPLGLILAALGASLLRHALARLRFQQSVTSPGLVELDEAQLGYMGPQVGGFISLAEATELRLVTLQGRRLWRIKQADGQAMLVPVDAEGAGQLFDAFAALPGMDVAALARAVTAYPGAPAGGLPAAGPQMLLIWRRAADPSLPRQGRSS